MNKTRVSAIHGIPGQNPNVPVLVGTQYTCVFPVSAPLLYDALHFLFSHSSITSCPFHVISPSSSRHDFLCFSWRRERYLYLSHLHPYPCLLTWLVIVWDDSLIPASLPTPCWRRQLIRGVLCTISSLLKAIALVIFLITKMLSLLDYFLE